MTEAVTLSGIVLADGSLHVADPVPLPQGEVEVIVRPIASRKIQQTVEALARARVNRPTSKRAKGRANDGESDPQRVYEEYEYGGGD